MTKLYRDFMGVWDLDVDASEYEQGAKPVSGYYHISEKQGELTFLIGWQDTAGERHSHVITGKPDGIVRPFSGGELVDSMSVTALTPTLLISAAYFQGKELMVARCELVESGRWMQVSQSVRLPDGSTPTNVARYCRARHS